MESTVPTIYLKPNIRYVPLRHVVEYIVVALYPRSLPSTVLFGGFVKTAMHATLQRPLVLEVDDMHKLTDFFRQRGLFWPEERIPLADVIPHIEAANRARPFGDWNLDVVRIDPHFEFVRRREKTKEVHRKLLDDAIKGGSLVATSLTTRAPIKDNQRYDAVVALPDFKIYMHGFGIEIQSEWLDSRMLDYLASGITYCNEKQLLAIARLESPIDFDFAAIDPAFLSEFTQTLDRDIRSGLLKAEALERESDNAHWKIRLEDAIDWVRPHSEKFLKEIADDGSADIKAALPMMNTSASEFPEPLDDPVMRNQLGQDAAKAFRAFYQTRQRFPSAFELRAYMFEQKIEYCVTKEVQNEIYWKTARGKETHTTHKSFENQITRIRKHWNNH